MGGGIFCIPTWNKTCTGLSASENGGFPALISMTQHPTDHTSALLPCPVFSPRITSGAIQHGDPAMVRNSPAIADAEVTQFDDAVGADEEVGALDVAMGNSTRVQKGKTR
eukprot:CAMPEP_0175986770 /NCGR_PEP_ID=MMETSP0108-20121206/50327_1 /TAXON_ID=195067 ORGANISM="Goniomonas pacifica, Strain CCMP1869" /NCGR_SAMPLE_ID=MMETSP0108 /ASSEMBLY_ACC=CAM_ASM_000204 /LENGTH=109 /DNA_ID=CAMNT_0017317951 /DNA_START=197 /DNA_END=526 /DNA_ORIENTATION=-